WKYPVETCLFESLGLVRSAGVQGRWPRGLLFFLTPTRGRRTRPQNSERRRRETQRPVVAAPLEGRGKIRGRVEPGHNGACAFIRIVPGFRPSTHGRKGGRKESNIATNRQRETSSFGGVPPKGQTTGRIRRTCYVAQGYQS
ncbi:unnamed protein product, partial [Ectocarpus fasciculatus]